MNSLKTIWSTTEIFLFKDILIQPSEVQKPETGQKTGPRINRKFLWLKQYVNTNSYALEFFGYGHQKYKNRKPDRKPDPGIFFPQKLRNSIKFDGLMKITIITSLYMKFQKCQESHKDN